MYSFELQSDPKETKKFLRELKKLCYKSDKMLITYNNKLYAIKKDKIKYVHKIINKYYGAMRYLERSLKKYGEVQDE